MIGSNIKEYLRDNGIKQTFLADKVGVSNSVISDICNRDRTIDCVLYLKICKALNVPFETFLKGVEV